MKGPIPGWRCPPHVPSCQMKALGRPTRYAQHAVDNTHTQQRYEAYKRSQRRVLTRPRWLIQKACSWAARARAARRDARSAGSSPATTSSAQPAGPSRAERGSRGARGEAAAAAAARATGPTGWKPKDPSALLSSSSPGKWRGDGFLPSASHDEGYGG